MKRGGKSVRPQDISAIIGWYRSGANVIEIMGLSGLSYDDVTYYLETYFGTLLLFYNGIIYGDEIIEALK